MTKVAVMQPYLFPYLGYFQLTNAVNEFIFLDDVSWIKKGWINRNMLKDDHRFTIPVVKASQNKKINEIYISEGWSNKLMETLRHMYLDQPYWNRYKDFIEFLVRNCEGEKFYKASSFAVEEICKLLTVNTRFHYSSDFEVGHLSAEFKIRQICKDFNAEMYINPIGGRDLIFYQPDYFNPIKLRFMYNKFTLPTTSIIDLLFIYGEESIKNQLNTYELIEK